MTIEHNSFEYGPCVIVKSLNEFIVDVGGAGSNEEVHYVDRNTLAHLSDVIRQALNTSAEELGDA